MEQKKNIQLGGSLAVPWVQDLAKTPLTTVPDRYIRADQDSPPITDPAIPLPEIPVIDMSRLLLSSDDDDSPELQKLHTACRDWGFFQVIKHGVSSEAVEKMKVETENLFKLPMEEKKKLWQRDGQLDGFGQGFVVSDQQKLDWGDLFYTVIHPLHHRKPYLFPHLSQSFREAAEAYTKGVRGLVMSIFNLMAKALKMEEEDMKEVFGGEEGMQSFRINYYPPCPQPELVTGFTAHSDAVGLTVLLQVNEVDGLQIKKDGLWIPVSPLPDAFVVDVGDILEMVTNGNYRSVVHKAMVNSVKERLSIATFHYPKLDADFDFGPAPSLITPQTPAAFRRTNLIDYLKGRYSRDIHGQGKSYIDVYRLSDEV